MGKGKESDPTDALADASVDSRPTVNSCSTVDRESADSRTTVSRCVSPYNLITYRMRWWCVGGVSLTHWAVPENIHTPPTEGVGISWGVGGSECIFYQRNL